MDYYDILGLDESASDELIKKRYKELARKYHPDKAQLQNCEESTKRFQDISVAYHVLIDPENRKRLKKLKSTSMFHTFASQMSELSPNMVRFLLDIMQTGTITSSAALFLFMKKFSKKLLNTYQWNSKTLYRVLETLFNMSSPQLKDRDEPFEIDVSADLKSVYSCEERTIKIPRTRTCKCKGHGSIYICSNCNLGYQFDGICIKCDSTSLTPMQCKTCNGTGEKEEIKTFTISLGKKQTKFVEDGHHHKTHRLPGDLIFNVKAKPTTTYNVWNTNDLVHVRTISLEEMVNGINTPLCLPDGRLKTIKINGPIQPTSYKKTGWGLPINGTLERGTLYISCTLKCTEADMKRLKVDKSDNDNDNLSLCSFKTCDYRESAVIHGTFVECNEKR